ncbi:Fe-S cluster assembly ATPase SufC [Candidatus Daviesbacteria bacterium]|nr:Fe-S cluster assembly ATPase SufC [Candidatus Daviesbacteria bacterium]
MKHVLKIENLQVKTGDQLILAGVNMTIKSGEIHALMGPNGSGKSTLAQVVMGNPEYQMAGGKIYFDDCDIGRLSSDKRAQMGLFLAFQYPPAVPGVSVASFLKTALISIKGSHYANPLRKDHEGQVASRDRQALREKLSVKEFLQNLKEQMKDLAIDETFTSRFLNDGFSGGEKKKLEVLQMTMLQPKIAIMDETDSGLDVDALKVVAGGISRMVYGKNGQKKPDAPGILLITHYRRLLDFIKPDFVHIFLKGRVITSGSKRLVSAVEDKGYDWFKSKFT